MTKWKEQTFSYVFIIVSGAFYVNSNRKFLMCVLLLLQKKQDRIYALCMTAFFQYVCTRYNFRLVEIPLSRRLNLRYVYW